MEPSIRWAYHAVNSVYKNRMPDRYIKGRGASSNPDNRYQSNSREDFDDGWGTLDDDPPPLRTELLVDRARRVIAYNDSPDVPFDRSINPYRGCEHGCIYCYARPTHAWLGHSPGLEFESLLYHKPDAVACLRRELAAKSYSCAPIALGANTDAYQPVERGLRLTRVILELLAECRHPVIIITKSALIERDLELLAGMAQRGQLKVWISITSLDAKLARALEPRAAAPHRRLQIIERLRAAGIPVGVLVAPLIPVLTDPEMETVLQQAREAGAGSARSILLRLPLEVAPLFNEWLQTHAPGQANRVLQRIRDTRGGDLYSADFTQRMRGSGVYADLFMQRFELAVRRLGFSESPELDCSGFCKPPADSRQLNLL